MTFLATLLLKLGLLAVAVSGVFIGQKYLKTKDDNVYEELVEQAIKDQTGVEIDLTPLTPEILEGHEKDMV